MALLIQAKLNESSVLIELKALWSEEPRKCPAIVTFNLSGDQFPHIMVATNALKGIEFIQGNDQFAVLLSDIWFINCKNSYRDDPSEPGIVCNSLQLINS